MFGFNKLEAEKLEGMQKNLIKLVQSKGKDRRAAEKAMIKYLKFNSKPEVEKPQKAQSTQPTARFEKPRVSFSHWSKQPDSPGAKAPVTGVKMKLEERHVPITRDLREGVSPGTTLFRTSNDLET